MPSRMGFCVNRITSLRCRRLAQEPVSHIHRLDGVSSQNLAGSAQSGPANFLAEE